MSSAIHHHSLQIISIQSYHKYFRTEIYTCRTKKAVFVPTLNDYPLVSLKTITCVSHKSYIINFQWPKKPSRRPVWYYKNTVSKPFHLVYVLPKKLLIKWMEGTSQLFSPTQFFVNQSTVFSPEFWVVSNQFSIIVCKSVYSEWSEHKTNKI